MCQNEVYDLPAYQRTHHHRVTAVSWSPHPAAAHVGVVVSVRASHPRRRGNRSAAPLLGPHSATARTRLSPFKCKPWQPLADYSTGALTVTAAVC